MKENRTSPTSILKKLESIENELREVREELTQSMIPPINLSVGTSSFESEYTLEDLYEAFGSKKRSYAVRLQTSLEKSGIKTLAEFLALTPGQLIGLDGVGVETLKCTKKALDKLGIGW